MFIYLLNPKNTYGFSLYKKNLVLFCSYLGIKMIQYDVIVYETNLAFNVKFSNKSFEEIENEIYKIRESTLKVRH